MNEKDGYFRVATSDDNGNNLFVFDSELNEVGKVTGFAKGESIRAVNYLGDMAYVITYEQTDPLFVIDLSNPSAPEIKGSVEITGFSSNLVFVDENTILGVGYDDTWGIKLALFDVSNPTSPKVLDSYVMENAYSNAQSNYKAIVVNRDKGYFAIDYNKTSTDDYSTVTGGLIINVENGKINITNNYKLNTGDNCSYAQRLTYINDTIYILDDYGNIYSFNN
jgi:uncharacterized secreted protein with C-terminal beta-propeller domain